MPLMKCTHPIFILHLPDALLVVLILFNLFLLHLRSFCMFCKDQTRIVQMILKSLLMFYFCLITVITAFCYDCVNDCATMNCSSNHFSLCPLHHCLPGPWALGPKVSKICSMSSNKISDAFFLWSHL